MTVTANKGDMGHYVLQGNPEIRVHLRRSARARRISLRVSGLDARITLTLPRGIPESEGLAFAEETGEAEAMADLRGRWPDATYVEDAEAIRGWVEAGFAQKGEARLHMIGAPFQIKVWEALLNVPTGHVTTYSDIATAIGRPRAVRAVGTAVGRNPVSFLIPCHRALRKSGALGGYHWGLPVKRALLAWESARLEAG